jgi:hypothetical protein
VAPAADRCPVRGALAAGDHCFADKAAAPPALSSST